MSKSPLIATPADSADALVAQYQKCLVEVLERHAPIKKKTFVIRQENPWFSAEIAEARRRRRSAERVLRARRIEIDRQIPTEACKSLENYIRDAKVRYI